MDVPGSLSSHHICPFTSKNNNTPHNEKLAPTQSVLVSSLLVLHHGEPMCRAYNLGFTSSTHQHWMSGGSQVSLGYNYLKTNMAMRFPEVRARAAAAAADAQERQVLLELHSAQCIQYNAINTVHSAAKHPNAPTAWLPDCRAVA